MWLAHIHKGQPRAMLAPSRIREAAMSRRKKDPLRESTEPERQELNQLSRSQVAPAVEVTRARILLAVAAGDDYQDAARAVGRRSGDAVSHLVARFNAEGTAALTPRHGGGEGAR